MSLTRIFICPPESLPGLLDELRDMGARVTGDEHAGTLVGDTFLGLFEGHYSHDGERLTVTVTRKPAAIPDDLLMDRLERMARRRGLTSVPATS